MTRTLKFILASLCLLLIPLLGTVLRIGGWVWDATDFAVAAALLAALGASIAYATRPQSTRKRIIGISLIVLVLLTYVHLAVGLVDWLPFGGN